MVDMNRISSEWIAARNVIAQVLREISPGETQVACDHNAAAIIARLANHKPPILLTMEGNDADV